ncbi:MAG: beta-lactamase domain protein [Ramlibacter sp.]|nr:beta-lactamase domain protein [Ramlibacter sp.]
MLPQGVTVLERGWLSSNNVVICGRSAAAVVDSGYWTHAEQTVRLVEAVVGTRQVATLVNTHLHSDHCGGNAALQQRFPGVRTRIPPGLAEAVQVWDTVALTYQPTGQFCPRFTADSVLTPGSPVMLGDSSWEVYAAPGHDPNSVVLFEPDSRTLISADALWQNGFGVVFQELEGEQAFDEVAETLDLIEDLHPTTVIPGHGAVFSDVDAALGRARSRLAAYQAFPSRHAAHAAKVLIKFKLLELQRVQMDELVAWAEKTPYFRLVHTRWFADVPWGTWLSQLVEELIRSRAAERVGSLLINA